MSYTKKTWDETIRDLDATFERWNADHWATIPGRPGRSRPVNREERTVAVFFQVRGRDMRLECSEHDTKAENLRALYNTIEAYRLMEVRGTAGLMAELLKQLPAPTTNDDPYRVLGVAPTTTLEVAETAYRALMRVAHPDRPGGSQEHAAKLNAAIEIIRKARQS